jgi:cytochrome bd ubiquinol oxidase subunit II
MDNSLTLFSLQHYWWIIISLLAGILVFLLFVQGGQTLLFTVGKNDTEKTLLVNSLGRKWEFTFTTLVVFGGAFFASFPLFYSTSFGGAYGLWMSILFCFIIQAISYEYRSKPNNFLGKRTYEVFLFINGAFGTILLGVAVATFFTGSKFMIDFSNITKDENVVISQWMSSAHGLEAIANPLNLLLGLAVFFLSRILGSLYFINNISNEAITIRARKQVLYNSIPFLVFFIGFLVLVFLSEGYSTMPDLKLIYLEKYKYFTNLIDIPFTGIIFLTGVILVLSGILFTIFGKGINGIWFSGTGTILTVFALFICIGFNYTAFYPSTVDFQSSLTIENASSSFYTLKVMSYVSLLIPFVTAYIVYTWKAINSKQISEEELKNESHSY